LSGGVAVRPEWVVRTQRATPNEEERQRTREAMQPEEHNALCVAEPAIQSLLTVYNEVYWCAVPVTSRRKSSVLGPTIDGYRERSDNQTNCAERPPRQVLEVPKKQERRNANNDDEWHGENRSKHRDTEQLVWRDMAASY